MESPPVKIAFCECCLEKRERKEFVGRVVRAKKDTLAVKTATEKRAVLKDNLANDKTVKELLTMLQEVTK